MLKIIDLSFVHSNQSQPTIEHIDLTVAPGEVVLIAGATGSGKSTLLNCLAGIAPIHIGGRLSGEIQYQNQSILSWSIQQRSRFLGMVLQNVETQIFTEQVSEEVIFGLENFNTPPNQIAAIVPSVLQEFNLAAQHNWRIDQLSAGQKQRLILGCVLAMRQSILMLDEPFAYLDRSGADLLLQLLQSRAQQGQAVLLIEHRLDLVRQICDRAFYLDNGRLSTRPTAYRVPATPNRPTPSAQIVLQTRNLSWGGYPAFPDLVVQAGKTVLIRGDNGCGKTTLLKLLSGLLKPTTGTIERLGNIRDRSTVEIAKKIGFVLQNPNHQLFAETVQQEVLQPGVLIEAANDLLIQLDLIDRVDQHPQSLSQGQKRRLALAATLARRPAICLLDEITVGQDPRSLSLMLNALQTFTQQGSTLILTSHDADAVAVLAPKVVRLE